MQNQYKDTVNVKFGSYACHRTWWLSGSVMISLFWLTGCQPATVPLERTGGLDRSEFKVALTSNRENDKNIDHIETKEEKEVPIKFDLPRSIIVIDEPNETLNFYSPPKPKNIDDVMEIDKIARLNSLDIIKRHF